MSKKPYAEAPVIPEKAERELEELYRDADLEAEDARWGHVEGKVQLEYVPLSELLETEE